MIGGISPILMYCELACFAAGFYFYGKASGGWHTDLKRLHEGSLREANLNPSERLAYRRALILLGLGLVLLAVSVLASVARAEALD
jgi:hypothetical protein